MVALWGWDETSVTAVGFEPTPLRTGALSQRLRPLGQTVVMALQDVPLGFASHDTYNCMDAGARSSLLAFWYMHAKTKSKHASAGNRTRVTSMATMYSTTRPLMLCSKSAVPKSPKPSGVPFHFVSDAVALGLWTCGSTGSTKDTTPSTREGGPAKRDESPAQGMGDHARETSPKHRGGGSNKRYMTPA